MRHAPRALDGRTVRTELSSAITGRVEHDPIRAIAWMDGATPRDYAQLAPLVMDHAEANDSIARTLALLSELQGDAPDGALHLAGLPRR